MIGSGPMTIINHPNGDSARTPPIINFNFTLRSIARKRGSEETITAGPKSQRANREKPASNPAVKQRQGEEVFAIAQREQSANDKPEYQVFAQRSVPAKSTAAR